jgi:hypothetical protein
MYKAAVVFRAKYAFTLLTLFERVYFCFWCFIGKWNQTGIVFCGLEMDSNHIRGNKGQFRYSHYIQGTV